VKPATDGAFGFLFEVLVGFDKPFNQAPSLHVALTVILFDLYARMLAALGAAGLRRLVVLVVVSTLTTWQHHFIDLPTGLLLGLLCLWLWPVRAAIAHLARSRRTRGGGRWPRAISWQRPRSPPSPRLLAAPACGCSGPPWLGRGGACLSGAGSGLFAKSADGGSSTATRLLLLHLSRGRLDQLAALDPQRGAVGRRWPTACLLGRFPSEATAPRWRRWSTSPPSCRGRAE
jgi:hypothetical protein